MDRSKWSRDDERQLTELQERKDAFEKEAMQPIYEAIKRVDSKMKLPKFQASLRRIAAAWVDNADAIRDALKPFDSGARGAIRDSTRVEIPAPPSAERQQSDNVR